MAKQQPSEDAKARFKEALERKQQRSRSTDAAGSGKDASRTTGPGGHGNDSRRREFRRKSG